MTAFVGRTRELETLRARYRQAAEGRGNTVFVSGEAGAGKSTLVERFLSEVGAGPGAAKVVDGAFSEQFGTAEPLVAFIEAFKELLQSEGRSGGSMTWMDVAREVAPTWISALPVVGNVLEAGVVTAMALKKKEAGVAAAPVARQAVSEEALYFQYTEVLLRAAEDRPVVLFLDDLHWADLTSIGLLTHIARKIDGARVLLLGTFRPVDVEAADHALRAAKQELERYGVSLEIPLSSLEPEALERLLENRLGGPATPRLARWLEKHAGTNPLFYEELLTWLRDGGHAREREGTWDLDPEPAAVEIPRSAESALERRLERLEPEVYRVLEHASVEGDVFHSLVLARLLDVDELELEELLEPIVRVHRLVRLLETRDLPGGDISSVYQFAHFLVHDILRRHLQGKRKILLHRKVAGILVELYASDTTAVDAELSVHFDEGRQPEEAYRYSLRAADRAELLYAHHDAIEVLSRALRCAGDDPDRRRTALERLAAANRRTGRFEDAARLLADALAEAARAGDAEAELRLRRLAVEVELERGARPPAELLEEAKVLVRRARELGARAELCRLLWFLRRLPESVSATEGTRAALQKALEVARGMEDGPLRARAKFELAGWYIEQARSEEAVPLLRGALELCGAEADRQLEGACRNALGVCHVLAARTDEAIAAFEAARQTFGEIGDPAHALYVDSNLGGLLTRRGEFERAEERLAEALRVARRLAAANRVLFPLFQFAEHWEARGDWAHAADFWSRLREAAREAGYPEDALAAECGLGLVALERGALEEARSRLAAASGKLGKAPPWSETTEVWRRLAARVLAAGGDRAEALRHVEAAESALADGDRYGWARFRLLRATIEADADPSAAVAAAEEAEAAFRAQGAAPMAERAAALIETLEAAGGTA
ncbi:MAG: AAA family ATPase [Gemmatimonadota bacterium]|nr:AAA family ATPase [Gemmatimonadota bacterium]